MWKRGSFCVSSCLLVLISVGIGLCQDQEIDVRAERYHTLLVKRPGSVQLFDRFYDAWLDTGTLETLDRYLNRQLAANPNVHNHLVLASFFERQGKHVESLRLYREAAERDPQNGEVLYLKAQAELRTLDFDSAISDLERARTLRLRADLSEKCAKLLGKLYVRTTQTEKARAVWQQLLEKHPRDEDLYEDLIELQLAEGLYEGAIATSDQLLAITQDSYETVMRRLRRGDILQYSGKNEEALEAYASCLSLVGHGIWLEDQISAQIERVFLREDNLSGLRDFYAKLIKADAQRIGLKQRLARLLLQMNRHEEALALYQEILSVTPGDTSNQQAYVAALAKAKQFGKAIDLLSQMSTQHPEDRELLVQLAELYHQNRQDDQAAEALHSFVAKSEKTEYLFLRAGRILERYRLNDQAATVYQQLAETWPESLSAKEAYAQFLLRIEKTEEALALWREIAHSGDVAMLVRAAQAVSRRDHRELALQWLESQYEAYSDDVTYLATLCQAGLRLKHYDKTLTWARRQLEIAERFSQIRAAVAQVVAVAKRSNTTATLIDELAAREARSIQQVCLLSELYDSVFMSTEADALLDQVSETHRETALKQQIRLCRLRRDWSLAAEKTQALLAQTGTRDSLYVRELVDLYRKANDPEKALAWIPAWKKNSPGNVQPWLSEAQLLADSGKESDAISVLRRADQEFEGREEILSRLATLYTRANRTGDAQRIYWRLYENAGEMGDKIRWIRDMGYAAQADGSREIVIEKLKERKRDNPSSIVPCLALAEMYRQTDQYEERRRALIAATRIQSKDRGLLYEIARIEEQEGDWKKALQTLTRALSLHDAPSTRRRIAKLHILYGLEEAGYHMLLDLAGGSDVAARDAQALADAMAAGQSWTMTIDFLEGVLPQYPLDYKLHYLHAVALEEDGRDDEALEAFLSLLSMTEEIPGNTAKPVYTSRARAANNHSTLFPVEALELTQTVNFYRYAYQHRRNRVRIPYGLISRSPVRTAVPVPPTIHDLAGFTLCHVLSLVHFAEAPEQRRIQALLELAGVRNVQVLLSMSAMGLDRVHRSIDTLATEFPSDKAVQALWMNYQMGYAPRRSKVDRYRAVFDLFVADRPRLAALAGLRYAALDGSDSSVLDRSTATIESISDPDGHEVQAIASVLQAADGGLSPEVRATLGQSLRTWYAQVRGYMANIQMLFSSIAKGLAQDEDLGGFIRFLDDEAWYDQLSGNYKTRAVFNRRGRSSAFISALDYPPIALPGFPSNILQIIFPEGGRSNAPDPDGLVLDPEALVRSLDQARHPILKVLLLLAAERLTEAQAQMDILLTTQPPSLTALVLGATLAAEQGDHQAAVALLEKARFLAMNSNHRRTLDGAIVAYAIELDPNESAAQVIVGQKAALRLRRNRMSQDQRTELAEAMETLGLVKEAEKLTKQAAPVSAARRGPTTLVRGSPRGGGHQRIQELFEKGKSDAALRLILTDLRNLALGSLYPQQPNYMFLPGQRGSDELVVLLGARGATEDLLTLADPGDTSSVRKLNEFARICEILDESDRARQTYERVLAKRPKDVTARVQLALLLGAEDPKVGAEQLQALDRRSMDQVGPTLSGLVQGRYYQQGAEEGLELMAVLAAYVETVEDANRVSLAWVDGALGTIAQASHRGGIRLDPLYLLGPGSGRADWGLAEQRRTLHNNLCRAMLGIPQLSIQGFSRLAAEAKSRDALTDEFLTLAGDALLLSQPYRGRVSQSTNPMYAIFRILSNRSSDEVTIRPTDPIVFLLRDSLDKGDFDAFVPEFVTRLQENGQTELAVQFEQMAALYTVPPEAFIEAAKTLLRGAPKFQRVANSLLSRKDCLAWMVDAYADRDIDVDVVTFLMDQVKRDTRSTPTWPHPRPEWHIQHCLTRLARHEAEAGGRFLEALVTLYVGPKDKRMSLTEKHYDRRRISTNSPNWGIHRCIGLLRVAAAERDLFFVMLDYVSQMPTLAPEIRPAIEGVLREVAQEEDPMEVLTFLRASPFLADTDRFTTIPWGAMKHNSVYASFIRQLMVTWDVQRKALREALGEGLKEGPQTFGTRLMIAHLSQNRAEAIHQAIAAHWITIPTAGETCQKEIASMVTDTLGGDHADRIALWSEEAQAVHEWLASVRSGPNVAVVPIISF